MVRPHFIFFISWSVYNLCNLQFLFTTLCYFFYVTTLQGKFKNKLLSSYFIFLFDRVCKSGTSYRYHYFMGFHSCFESRSPACVSQVSFCYDPKKASLRYRKNIGPRETQSLGLRMHLFLNRTFPSFLIDIFQFQTMSQYHIQFLVLFSYAEMKQL